MGQWDLNAAGKWVQYIFLFCTFIQLKWVRWNAHQNIRKYTLYNLSLFHGPMKREEDHVPIRSIAYGTLLFGGKKERDND